MDIVTTISSITQAIEGVRKLREIEKDFDAATYKLQIADLASSLADTKLSLLEIQGQIDKRDHEILRLREAVRFHGETVQQDGQVYEKGPGGKPIGMPFCPVCIVDDAIFIRLADDEKGVRGEAFCPRCKSKHSRVRLAV